MQCIMIFTFNTQVLRVENLAIGFRQENPARGFFVGAQSTRHAETQRPTTKTTCNVKGLRSQRVKDLKMLRVLSLRSRICSIYW
ncbi:MAG: hypothetical protein UT56_C0007G0029 [Candidatus Levybacteria bacterium GW2011_GWB1_39_7]|nr:MAG: hypothetical protein UT20_C0016G0014 [Candidatus Levybacteria bacterium GW2011_GWA1_39_11]KKR24861.1 MAG: hypothetical protein UT56_C0007G0029 [Candidatus Levybacteria bacterium GW2011_GWB1_39_7]KKR50102.1 MAG: hypothetical protein UT85_C0006G0031 [Candidatus Levybacteria bacterium GW2011_GWA2_40_16]